MSGAESVFVLRWVDGFQPVYPVNESDWDAIMGLADTRAAGRWTALDVYVPTHGDRPRKPLKPSLLPYIARYLIALRDQAIDGIGSILAPFGEFLPLNLSGGRLELFNVFAVLPALDESRSEVWRIRSGAIIDVKKYVLRKDIDLPAVFRLSSPFRSEILMKDSIVEKMRSTGMLSGVDFIRVDS